MTFSSSGTYTRRLVGCRKDQERREDRSFWDDHFEEQEWALARGESKKSFPGWDSKYTFFFWHSGKRAQTETEREPKFLGSKFIKQAGSDSADSSPKAEPQEQRGLSLYTI
jgi:hypothetical protein